MELLRRLEMFRASVGEREEGGEDSWAVFVAKGSLEPPEGREPGCPKEKAGTGNH